MGPQFPSCCSFSKCLLPHILSEDCWLESSVQGYPYHYKSLDNYCCLLCYVHIHGLVPGDYLECWYDHCLIQSGSRQPLTGQSGASFQPFPPLIWWSLWLSPLSGPRYPHSHSLPFRKLLSWVFLSLSRRGLRTGPMEI